MAASADAIRRYAQVQTPSGHRAEDQERMIARWEQGRADIDDLLVRQSLDRVAPSRELADAMLEQAELHLDSAKLLLATDAPGAFQLAYDAARKSLAAILANQGLR